MAEQTYYPGTITTTAYGSWDWINADDAKAFDGHWASVSATGGLGSSYSYYLNCTNFGFSIPVGSTINGIVAEVYCQDGSTGTAYSTEYETRLSFSSGWAENKATERSLPKWPTSPTTFSYGGQNDLWAVAWTRTEINASTFGVRLLHRLYTVTGQTTTARIDFVRLTVYYTTPSVSVAITGKGVSSGKGTLTRSGTANVGILGRVSTTGYADSPSAGTASVSLLGRSVSSGRGELIPAAPGSGMFMWNWPYGIDAYWHEVLGSLMPESEATISGVSAACSVGTVAAVTDSQVPLIGLESTASIGVHVGYSYAEVFITGLGITSAVQDVSAAAHGDVNVPTVGRYATASIGTLIAAGTSVSFASGVWLLYPVTIFVEQQWQCDIEVSEVHNV